MRMRVLDLTPYTGNTARTGCCETQILCLFGKRHNLTMLTQCMNALLVHFHSDKLQAWASCISLPALMLIKLETQSGQEHNHHTAALPEVHFHREGTVCKVHLMEQVRMWMPGSIDTFGICQTAEALQMHHTTKALKWDGHFFLAGHHYHQTQQTSP